MLLDIDEASRTRPGRLLPHETRDTLFYIISLAWLAILIEGIPFAVWLMHQNRL